MPSSKPMQHLNTKGQNHCVCWNCFVKCKITVSLINEASHINVKQVTDLPLCFSAAITHVDHCDLLITCIWHVGHQSGTKTSQSSAVKTMASLDIWPRRRHSTLPEIFNRMLLHGKMLTQQRQIIFLKCLKYKPVPRLKAHYLFQYLEQVHQGALPTFANLTENQSVSNGVWIKHVFL